MEKTQPKKILLYDDTCTTCTVAKHIAQTFAQDRISPVGITTPEGKTLIETHRLDVRASAYTIDTDGHLAEKDEMVSEVLAQMGIFGNMCAFLWHLFPKSTRVSLYDFVARHRS